MTECYCPDCGKKGSLYYDEKEVGDGTRIYWKVGHKGTKNRTYCYLGREEDMDPKDKTVTVIEENGIQEKTIGKDI